MVACSLSLLFSQSHLNQDLLKMAKEGQDALVRTLLDAGAAINAKDEDGRTALMLAAMEGHLDTVAALLDAGADVEARDNDGKTAQDLATAEGQNEIVQVLGIDPKERQLWEKHNLAGMQAYQRGRYAEAETSWRMALELAEQFRNGEYLVGTSLNNRALLYHEQGEYADAEPLYQRALAIREKALGPEHPQVAQTLNNLAGLYREQGKYAKAEPLYQRSLDILEVAANLNDLALLYHNQGKYAEAEPLYQRALVIAEKTMGPEHPQVAANLNNLAGLYRDQGKYAEAEPLYQRSLDILEKALGPEHLQVAASLNNLAALYHNQGKYAEAEPLYQRSLDILEKALGPEHPQVAQTLSNLAELYRDQGKYAEAEPLYQRALTIREKTLGPEHPQVAASLNDLALLYHNQGKYAEAEPLYQRSLDIREKALGPEHPQVATGLNNLAGLYRDQVKYAEAEPLYQRALDILEKALGPEHHQVAQTLNNLAGLYRDQVKYAEAEPFYQRALAIREKALGPEHPQVAASLNNLALLYHNQRKYSEAEPLYQRALVIEEKTMGPEHPQVAASLNNLAGLYLNQSKYAEAEPLYQRSLDILEKGLGPEHPQVAQTLNSLALLYHNQGKYSEAEPLYRRVLVIAEKTMGPEHPQVAASLNNLAGLYHNQGKYAEAEPLYQRSLDILEKGLGPEHPNVASSLESSAIRLRKTDRNAEADKLEKRARAPTSAHPGENPLPILRDVTQRAGLNIVTTCGSIEKKFIIEGNGSGCAWIDYNDDGWTDLYIVTGISHDNLFAGEENAARAPNFLFRNNGDGTFAEVTGKAGVSGTGLGNGVAAADYDNDGLIDLFVTNYGRDLLYRNNGDGTFTEVAGRAGVAGGPVWSTGATFGDYDRDGWVDLYVARYLEFDVETPPLQCGYRGIPVMCGPKGLTGSPDVLYRNNGDGTFTDVTVSAGVVDRKPLYGFSPVFEDFDNDGYPDLFVTNDTHPNFLYHNQQDGTFREVALLWGVGYNQQGTAQASMGVAVGDVGGDGFMDLFVTTFSDEYYPFFRNAGGGTFEEVSQRLGLATMTLPYLGWATFFLDFDNDGALDLFVANGHLFPQVEPSHGSYRQQDFLLRGSGDFGFVEVTDQVGLNQVPVRSSRGGAYCDYDNDGDLDLLVLAIDDRPTLLRNDGGNRQNWIQLILSGRRSNRSAIGATVKIVAGSKTQFGRVRSGGSFLSQHDLRLHFGLANASLVDLVEITWPNGQRQTLQSVKTNQIIRLQEGEAYGPTR